MVGANDIKGSAHGVICGVALLSLSLFLPGCSSPSAEVPPAAGGPVTLTIGYPHITGIDPLHGLQQAARLIMFEGLVSVSRDGKAQPRLAESWSQSDTGLEWTIRLRSNARFHDGSPADAGAVKASLERSIASPERDLSPGLADIVRIDARSDRELLISLSARSTFMLENLTVPIMKIGETKEQFGTGPFVTTSTSASEVVMNAVDVYYRGRPKIDRIVIRAYPTVRTAWAAMMRGDVDFLYEVGPEAVEFMQGESSINIFPFLRSYALGVIVNSRRPELSDPRVRRAMNHAVDRASIVTRALRGHGIAASGSAWPPHWAFDESVPSFTYDVGRASALLDSASLKEVKMPDGKSARFRFTCIFPENFALWERLGLQVQRNLAEVGIDMQLETLSVNEFNRRIADANFDAVLTEFVVGNSPSRPYFFWHSQSRRNVFGYSNPAMDRALDGIRRASSDSDYRKAFREFQVENIDNPPAIFLILGETTRAVSKRFHVIAPPGSDILPTIGDWRPADPARTAN